ncbi:hypothetical protein BDZ97DRAFT_1815206 [Flammula alnicola]|nr:hypothetical protein BDZ97DRAFT_1815206 [Flammula alnicola]
MSDGSSRGRLSRIDTNFTLNVYEDPRETNPSPSRGISAEIPSIRVPVSPANIAPSDVLPPRGQHTNTRARNEARKLLSHVLIQLANRTKPPSIIDTITSIAHDSSERGISALAETLREAVKRGSRPDARSERRTGTTEDDSEDEKDSAYTTDDTIDLMLQLKDVLTMAIAQGWQIFDDSSLLHESLGEVDSKLSSTFRRSRNSFRTGGKRSRSTSPYKGQVQVPQLLSLCMSILASVVSEDCRYRVASPRPSRPPNSLQILTLNIAQFLIHSHRHDPQVISQIASAMIPAFYTFHHQMHARLLSFFESSVIRVVLHSLGQLQGLSVQEPRSEASMQADNRTSLLPGLVLPSMSGEIQSTNNPHHHHIYIIFIPYSAFNRRRFRFFGASGRTTSRYEVSAQLTNLLRLIASLKLDAYNDLLEIVAYRGPKSRRLAIADIRHGDCRSCLKSIHGFSLLCPCCMTAVHFDCYDYPEGNYNIQYSMENDYRVQRVAMCRFSDIQVNWNFLRRETSKNNHIFKPSNWFTLCLCFVCQKPLWGCFAQGLKCGQCPTALHLKCLPLLSPSKQCGAAEVTSKDMTIDWSVLRQSCLEHFPILHSTREQLDRSSYEEIMIYHSVLRSQLQILSNGIAFGSVVVQNGKNSTQGTDNDVDSFELHKVLELCEKLLDSGRLSLSPLTQQYMQDTNETQSKPSIMFNWSYLEYITAAIKTSFPQSRRLPRTTSEFLNVEQALDVAGDIPESASLPYESATLMHIRNILEADFSLRSNHAAKFILDQLHHLSFFDRIDNNPYPFEDLFLEKDVKCVFPLPLGLDLSMNVETLVSSIEASLLDLDLSSNEFGFLLLTRRFWPNGLASEYGLKRLAGRVLSWILDEDDNLAIILREFVAKQKRLPGVRSDRNAQPWPSPLDDRPGPINLASNGGDFVAARRSLLSRFALPWLLELHDLDPQFYCQTIFDTCSQVAADRDVEPEVADLFIQPSKRKDYLRRCDDVLRSIIKLSHCSVIFSVFDALFLRWMDFAFESDVLENAIPSLHRLFSRENETMHQAINASDTPHPAFVDPLRAISNLASQSEVGLSRSLSYLSMVIKSGVHIPFSTFKHFLTLTIADKRNSLDNANMLVRAIVLSLWLRSMGRQDLQGLVASIHSHLSSHISQSLVSGENPSVCLSIIRLSLVACLRMYGCERSSILAADMLSASEVEHLPSRRKVTVHESVIEDPVIIEPEILTALELYTQSNVDSVVCLVAKFLNMFLTESPFLEAFEIDNFILRNGKLIALCAWTTYDIQREDVAVVRTNLLLRSLLIDAEAFQDILHMCMDPMTSSIQQRLSGVNRLFRMISDVTSPAFEIEGRQWRSSVIEVFYYYFSALWADPSEEIRMAVKSSSAALLPAHFEIVSQCWSESLSKAPITERIRLVGFLIQLHPHFPGWKVLSWDCMIETLVEYDYDTKGRFNDSTYTEKDVNAYRLSTADPDMAHLRISIILLGLQMIADGIEIDNFSLMKLKVQFVQVAGFSKISVIPTQSGESFHLQFTDITEISESAYPCIEELPHVVDAPYYAKLTHSALGIADHREDEIASVLIGSAFLDASLCILGTLRNLSSLPVLTLKCVLEALYITIHKYDFDDASFQHLQPLLRRAILRSIELLSQDISYELRQLALSIAQASIKKWHTFLGATISTILELVANEIAPQNRYSQDPLIVQGKLLIGNTLQTQIFNTQGKDASVISNAICDPLLRDTLVRAVDCDPPCFQTVLQNISSFIEIVYSQGYTSDLLIFTGQQLTHLVRRMSDGILDGPDPSPLIVISTILIQNNKRHSKELLPYVDVVLRVALNRLRVDESCLTGLIDASIANKPKKQEPVPGSIDIINVLFDILVDGFRMKTKMLPLTIKSLIEVFYFPVQQRNNLHVCSTELDLNGEIYVSTSNSRSTFVEHGR